MNDRVSTDLVKVSIPSLAMSETELVRALESSVYPGAKLESIKLVIGYCKAAQLDPMQKPVHIVPMSVRRAGTKDQYDWRDVIMPGIGLYRTQAARSGAYAGVSEPEFGPMATFKFGENSVQHPEWCKVSARRIVQGHIVEFTALEYWVENYATAGRDSTAPNAMWKKRPRGQLAKCAEAQALRKAFPEVGSAPTAEEMEGKTLDEATIDGATGAVVPTQIPGPQARSAPRPEPKAAPEREPIDGQAAREPEPPTTGTNTGDEGKPAAADGPIREGQLRILRAKAKQAALTDADINAKFGVEKPEDLKFSQFEAVQAWIVERAAKNG